MCQKHIQNWLIDRYFEQLGPQNIPGFAAAFTERDSCSRGWGMASHCVKSAQDGQVGAPPECQ